MLNVSFYIYIGVFNVAFFIAMLNVVMLNAIMLSVVAPSSVTKLAIKSRNLAPPIEILSVHLGS